MREIITDSSIEIDNQIFKINAGTGVGSCYVEILERLHNQMQSILKIHNKVLFVRVDLRFFDYSPASTLISTILRKVKRWLKQHYQITQVGHLWVREQERAKHQHYHLIIMVDGNKLRTPHALIKQIEHQAEYRGLPKPYTPQKCYTMIKRDDNKAFADAFYRGSYLAKTRGKGYKGKLSNNYSSSRVKSIANY